ncbi:hypothetical protein, partial [Nocardiopsis rhodophaea]|uniref:hypothetical protein n=1 Tax=Nocardiopsis rhodophaea TaxID=280238 RepID=UPI0039EF8884
PYAPAPTPRWQAPSQAWRRPPAHKGAPARFTASAQSRRPRRPIRDSRAGRRRANLACKRRVLRETAGLTRPLFTTWTQLPYSCVIIAVILLAKALGLLA